MLFLFSLLTKQDLLVTIQVEFFLSVLPPENFIFCYIYRSHSLSPKLLLSWLLIRERGIFMTGTSQEEIGWPRFCGYQTSNCHLRYVAVSAHTTHIRYSWFDVTTLHEKKTAREVLLNLLLSVFISFFREIAFSDVCRILRKSH